MVDPKMKSAKRLIRKAVHVAPLVMANPRLLSLMRQGVHPEIYERLDGAWLLDAKVRTVLDIGANTGQFSRTINALLPEATVYAFEPQADCFTALEASFAGDSRLRAVRTAIGDEDGEITFYRNAFSQSSSALQLTDLHKEAFPWARESEAITVPVHRLDTLGSDLDLITPMLVKIDVQGFEDRVLRGGERVIRQADFVLIETAFDRLYEGEATFPVVYELMSGFGFRYMGNLDQVDNPATGRPLYADALFLREG